MATVNDLQVTMSNSLHIQMLRESGDTVLGYLEEAYNALDGNPDVQNKLIYAAEKHKEALEVAAQTDILFLGVKALLDKETSERALLRQELENARNDAVAAYDSGYDLGWENAMEEAANMDADPDSEFNVHLQEVRDGIAEKDALIEYLQKRIAFLEGNADTE